MSLPRYPEYKPSGVEWLGEVPEHWDVKRVKLLFNVGRGRVIAQDELIVEGIYPVFSSQTLDDGCLGYINTYDFDCKQITWTTDGANAGTVFLREGKHNCTNVCGTLQTKNDLQLIEYIFYCLQYATQFYKRPDTNGAKIMNGEMAEIFVTLPSPEEQQTIAAFLDCETGKIDALIAEQQRLVELLAEKRRAVISHAVTQGLPSTSSGRGSNVPLKDSGIAWLGEVPAHWEVKRIKRLIHSIEQGWSPQCEGFPVETSDEWGVLKVGCVNGGRFNPAENKTLPDNLEPIATLGIEKNDVLISRANSRELVGSAAVAQENYPRLMLCDKLYRLKMVVDLCLPEFLVFYLGIGMTRSQIELAASGASSSMLNIAQSTILELEIALPNLEEQLTITTFLERAIAQFDILTAEANRAIILLQERRSALISAAVTGKIDVRGQ